MSASEHRLVFLDFDGVLNRDGMIRNHTLKFEPDLMANLNRFLDDSKAQVVISSAWRDNWPLPVLVGFMEDSGFAHRKRVIGRTSRLGPTVAIRGREIGHYLGLYRTMKGCEVRFVVLDDYPDMGEVRHNHVHLRPDTGFTTERARKAMKVLAGG